jgi:ankyrin repeat protein
MEFIKLRNILSDYQLYQPSCYNCRKVGLFVVSHILLYMACARGSKNETNRLLSRADVNFVNHDDDSRTPLLVAAAEGHLDIVKMLYEKSADVNARDDQDDTALNAATDHNHLALASWLFEIGADFEAGGEDSRRALFKAVYNCSKLMVELLLAKGVDINKHRDDDGLTILSAAIHASDTNMAIDPDMAINTDMVELLLNKGADPNARNEDSSTALHVAFPYHCPKTNALLLEHKADVGYGRTKTRR